MLIKKFVIGLIIVTSLSVMTAGCNKGDNDQAGDSTNQTPEQAESSAEKSQGQ